MKSNLDRMDNVFRRELKDLSFSSPDGVWENIEMQLDGAKKAKLFNFYRIAAAILAITLIGSIYLISSQKDSLNKNENIIAKTNIESKSEKSNEAVNADKNIVENVLVNKEPKNKIATQKNSATKSEILENESSSIKEIVTIENDVINSVKDDSEDITFNRLSTIPAIITVEKTKLAFVQINKKEEDTRFNVFGDLSAMYAYIEIEENNNKPKQSKWLIGGEFSPLYSYRHVTSTGNSGYETGYYNQVENPIMSYSGGVNVQYKAFNRLTVQAGVYYSSMGQSLDYMSVYANQAYDLAPAEIQDRYLNAYEVSNSAGAVSFNTSYVIVDEKGARISNHSDHKGVVNTADPVFQDMNAEIQQNFKYIEVPVVFRYKIIDKLVDFNLIGGLGANFLIGNDVSLIYGNTKEIIGETKGVNPVNYSTSVGIGIEYPLMNRINIRFEPSFKYYLNEINSNSTVESHPYSIGVFTGINYSF